MVELLPFRLLNLTFWETLTIWYTLREKKSIPSSILKLKFPCLLSFKFTLLITTNLCTRLISHSSMISTTRNTGLPSALMEVLESTTRELACLTLKLCQPTNPLCLKTVSPTLKVPSPLESPSLLTFKPFKLNQGLWSSLGTSPHLTVELQFLTTGSLFKTAI